MGMAFSGAVELARTRLRKLRECFPATYEEQVVKAREIARLKRIIQRSKP